MPMGSNGSDYCIHELTQIRRIQIVEIGHRNIRILFCGNEEIVNYRNQI